MAGFARNRAQEEPTNCGSPSIRRTPLADNSDNPDSNEKTQCSHQYRHPGKRDAKIKPDKPVDWDGFNEKTGNSYSELRETILNVL